MYSSDVASPEKTIEPDVLANDPWLLTAQRFFSLALQFDYLSTGKGHQQSRRIVGERMQRSHARKSTQAQGLASGAEDQDAPDAQETTEAADTERAYLCQVAQVRRLSSSEEYSLAKRVRACDEGARNALVEANLGLVVMLARRYQRPGVQLLDLIAEGNFGLMAATRGFDPELGFRFPTYAKWAVRQAIERALPRLMTVRQTHLKRCAADSANTDALSANASGVSGAASDADAQEADASFAAPPDGQASGATEPQTSDNAYFTAQQSGVSDEEALALLAAPEDQEPPSAAQVLQRNGSLMRAMACLNERERTVINERFALDGYQAATLDQLAQRLQISIERVRQIECAAVKKLAVLLGNAGESAATLL